MFILFSGHSNVYFVFGYLDFKHPGAIFWHFEIDIKEKKTRK